MGADQSRDSFQGSGSVRKTETANFDFRSEVPSRFSKDEKSSDRSSNSWTKPTFNNFQSTKTKTGETSLNDSRSNCYWLEVGMDVVKRLDNEDKYQNIYSR